MSEAPKALSARILAWSYWPIIFMILSLKALIFLFGAISFQVNSNLPIKDIHEFLAIWNRWDAIHYVKLARDGYAGGTVIFEWITSFPLLSWMIRLFAVFLKDYVLAAFVVSGLASLVAGILLYELVRLDDSDERGKVAVLFLFIFPTSYFLHIGYNESLFLAIIFGSFLAARKRHWLLAGILGAFAGMTRINGLLLIPALAMEAYEEFRTERRLRWQWLFIGLPVLGFAVYAFLNYRASGDPLYFFAIQQKNWNRYFTWPWSAALQSIQTIKWRDAFADQMVVMQELFFVLLGLVFTVLSFMKLRRSYAIWTLVNWLLFTCTNFIIAVPRYTLVLFPVFILLARLKPGRLGHLLVIVWSILFLGLFSSVFVQGRWAF